MSTEADLPQLRSTQEVDANIFLYPRFNKSIKSVYLDSSILSKEYCNMFVTCYLYSPSSIIIIIIHISSSEQMVDQVSVKGKNIEGELL